MDSLCYATEHADRAVLSRQLELCRTLTGEFRMHYPIVCFKPSVWTKESGEEISVTLTSAYTLSMKLQVKKTCEAKTKEIVDAITDSVMHFSRSLFFQYGKKKYVTVFVCDTTVARCDVTSRARCDVTSRNDVLLTVPMDNFCYGLILSAASLSEGHYLLSPSPDSMWRPIRREELPWWPSSLGRLP